MRNFFVIILFRICYGSEDYSVAEGRTALRTDIVDHKGSVDPKKTIAPMHYNTKFSKNRLIALV